MQRTRFIKGYEVEKTNRPEFLNPYPWMSSVDAMVHLELEHRHIPFTYRYFDGDAPTLKYLIPDYAPEFTLSDYKLVIVVLGNFFGDVPAVLDRTALAKAALEQDGWKMAILLENDITKGVSEALNRVAPELKNPVHVGPPKPSPFGNPTFMYTRRRFLSGLALLRQLFNPKEVKTRVARIRKFVRPVASDSGRLRRSREGNQPSGA